MSQKRERESPDPVDSGSNEMPVYDAASEVVLQTKEGSFFVIKIQTAKRSETLKSVVEEAVTANTAIPLPNIRAHVLKYLVHYMKHNEISVFVRTSYSLLIELILATSYLDIDNGALLSKLTLPFRVKPTFTYGPEDKRGLFLLKRLMCDIEYYPKEEDGFTEEERALFLTKKAHLSEIHTVPMRAPTGRFCLLDLPRDLFARYIFPPLPQAKDRTSSLYVDYTEWIQTLLGFREKHVYFWHTTTKYIIRMAQKVLPEMASFDEDTQFEFMCRLQYHGYFVLKSYNITNADAVKHYGKKLEKEQTNVGYLYTALKKHNGSFKMMDEAVARIEQLQVAREARIAQEKRFQATNLDNAEKYLLQQGFVVRNDQIPEISDHLVVNFEQEPSIQHLLKLLEHSVVILLNGGKSADISRVATLTSPAKFRELLKFIPSKDEKLQSFIDLCLANGYVLSRTEIDGLPEFSIQAVETTFTVEIFGKELASYTTPEKFQELMLNYTNRQKKIMQQFILFKTRLEETGYLFSVSELRAFKSEKDALDFVSNIRSMPLNFIVEHTTHANFLKLME